MSLGNKITYHGFRYQIKFYNEVYEPNRIIFSAIKNTDIGIPIFRTTHSMGSAVIIHLKEQIENNK